MIKSLLSILSHPLNKNDKWNTVLRVLWWKMNQLLFRLPAVVELVPGRKIICYPDSSSGGLIIYKRLFDYEEMMFLQKHLNSTSTFIDVGVNIGDYSLIASSIIRKNTIHSFEPFKSVLKRFQENIQLNSIRNIKTHEMVVSNTDGYEYFDSEPESEVNHIAYVNSAKSIKIQSITLDTFAKNNNISQIDILKIDVEGAEMKVLLGAKKLLAKGKIKIILLELNRNNQSFGSTNKEIASYLKKHKYSLFTLDSGFLCPLTGIHNNDIINIICMKK